MAPIFYLHPSPAPPAPTHGGIIEESGDLSGVTTGSFKGFTLQASWGKAVCLTPDSVHC